MGLSRKYVCITYSGVGSPLKNLLLSITVLQLRLSECGPLLRDLVVVPGLPDLVLQSLALLLQLQTLAIQIFDLLK